MLNRFAAVLDALSTLSWIVNVFPVLPQVPIPEPVQQAHGVTLAVQLASTTVSLALMRVTIRPSAPPARPVRIRFASVVSKSTEAVAKPVGA